MTIRFRIRQFIGHIARAFSPGYSHCYRCGRPWSIAREHSTKCTETWGCFPLCEACWRELTPGDRIYYYRLLWLKWKKADRESDYNGLTYPELWELIERAVLDGK